MIVTGTPTCAGIYMIANLCDGRLYIGASTNLRMRALEHRSWLRRGLRENRHLQEAWDRYGEENFAFHVLAASRTATKADLETAEAYWMERFGTRDRARGYNLYGASGEQPEESRARLSAARRGTVFTPEHRENIRNARAAQVITEETKRKQSAAMQGRQPAPNTLAAARRANSRKYRVTSPGGQTWTIFNLTQFCRDHALLSPKMNAVARGVWKQHRGWRCERVKEDVCKAS